MARKMARIGCVLRMSRAISSMAIASGWETCHGRPSTCAAPRTAKLRDHAFDQIRGWGRGVGVLVLKSHRLPLEGAELMEWLNLDPFHILHGCHKAGDCLDVRRIVGEAWHQR